MTKKAKPSFAYGEPSESVTKALALLKPRRKPGTPHDDELVEWIRQSLMAEQFRRLRIIADYYGIDLSSTNGGVWLAYRLANDFVDGFNPLTPQRGARKSSIRKNGELFFEITRIMKEKDCKLSEAIEAVRKRGRIGEGKSRERVEAAYHRVKKDLYDDWCCIESALEQMRADNALFDQTSLSRLGELATKNKGDLP